MAGAHLKSMSATPIATWMFSAPWRSMMLSHLAQSVPTRSYGASKSNPPDPSCIGVAAAAAGVHSEVPEVAAPASAVAPAPFRNILRFNRDFL